MTTLASLCELIVDCEHRTAPTVASGFPLIRTPDIAVGRLNIDSAQRVDEATYLAWTKRATPRAGDLILAREAPVGNVGIVKPGVRPVLGQRTVLIRPREDFVDAYYLNYLMSGPELREWMQAVSVGATVPHLNMADIRSMEIPALPALATQRKIASILSAYDNLIENNDRRIHILGEIVERIYREWFVDFRYPGHENVPLEDSELGLIPRGWTISTLGDVCLRVLDGDWIETKDQGGDAYRLLQVSNIGLGSFRETGNYRYISGDTFTRLRCTEVTVGSILVSRMPDPIGRAWYVDHLDQPAVTAVDVAILESNPEAIDPRYCTFYLNTPRNLQYAAQRASGTTRARITRRDLSTFPIPVPPSDIRMAFGKILDDTGRCNLALTLASRNLCDARDILLPRLISGEVDVADLQIAMPQAAA